MTYLTLNPYLHQHRALPRQIVENEDAIGASIQLKQLSKHYGELTVLDQLDLNIQAGEFVAIVGKSGCGKSTLLRLIAGLEQQSQGNIDFAQHSHQDDVSAQQHASRHNLRVMFQNPRLLPWQSVIENIRLGLATTQFSQAEQLLKHIGLAEKAQHWPAQLSGGQQQRVALARALAHRPQILLLDEPLGALDALTRLEMQKLIEKLWLEKGFTALLVTHDVTEAVLLADRIIFLDQGKILQQFHINLARPRVKNHDFVEIEQNVLNAILNH
ncbi:ABC transporter ATP-binding protein [Acinetobacter larvae]|uniref:Aliphatic sulfonate ABC transporter ATP-binding protein n=1 Tax=Acinetobacter larvae TaxID=1789224 RepID=A0A1B2LVM5_9GAMM|nr:ATP-binding cassette domain-containing protein [Acinetobacter larvae]AOA56969.1 aliphatic sulfonate ABC transporter ATP-binding protein [Acinetobacter larvae]